jgi:transcriptional antiterminator Rof (Rho-off)
VNVGLVQACDDRRLFNFPLWPKQRALLEAVEAGHRLHVWALGRRSGKTTLAAIVGLHTCLFKPSIAARVRPGERFYAVAVATNLRQARLFVSAARSIVEASELLADQVVSVTEDEIVFATGGVLTAFPCSSRGGRGWPVAALLMDEAAFFLSETEGPQVAERVFEALVPSTAQFGGLARVIVASTPYGTDGLFAGLRRRGIRSRSSLNTARSLSARGARSLTPT